MSSGSDALTNLPPITLPSSNSRQSGYGSALMSPRPKSRSLVVSGRGMLFLANAGVQRLYHAAPAMSGRGPQPGCTQVH